MQVESTNPSGGAPVVEGRSGTARAHVRGWDQYSREHVGVSHALYCVATDGFSPRGALSGTAAANAARDPLESKDMCNMDVSSCSTLIG